MKRQGTYLGKILVVDDREENIYSVKQVLSDLDAEIVTAKSGEEALSAVLHHAFSVILMDVQMPGMNGFETASLIRADQSCETIPIIFLTAINKEDRFVFKGYDSGAVDYIFKPIDGKILRSKVNIFLELDRKSRNFEREVTKNRELMDNLRAQNTKLNEANRVKDQFIGMAAHDLRNPLTIIRLTTELLGFAPNEQIEHFKNTITHEAEHMMKLIDDLLVLNKFDSGKFELNKKETDIKELLENLVSSNTLLANNKGIEIERDLPSDKVIAFVDGDKITQVITNFISNAIKYSPKNTNINVNLTEKDKSVYIAVKDQGPGIKSEEQASVFNAFSKISNKPTGNESSTGLGLSICKKIIDSHGGKIGFESEPGKGSIFFFELQTEAH